MSLARRTRFPSLLNYKCSGTWGWDGPPAPQTGGYSLFSFTQIPSPPRRLGSSHPLSHWLARSSVFPVPPAGYPRFYTALPFCVLLLGRDLAIILPSAEKRSTYPSFSTGSFPFQRTPSHCCPRETPAVDLTGNPSPSFVSGDLPFTQPSPPEEPSIHTTPFFLKLSGIGTRLPFAEPQRTLSLPHLRHRFWGPLSPPR